MFSARRLPGAKEWPSTHIENSRVPFAGARLNRMTGWYRVFLDMMIFCGKKVEVPHAPCTLQFVQENKWVILRYCLLTLFSIARRFMVVKAKSESKAKRNEIGLFAEQLISLAVGIVWSYELKQWFLKSMFSFIHRCAEGSIDSIEICSQVSGAAAIVSMSTLSLVENDEWEDDGDDGGDEDYVFSRIKKVSKRKHMR